MKALFRMFGHVFLIALLFSAQITWIIISAYELGMAFEWVQVLFTVFSIFVVIWILNRPGDPSFKLIWIVIVLLMPLVGWAVYLLTGGGRPSRHMRRRIAHAAASVAPYAKGDPGAEASFAEAVPRHRGLARYLAGQHFPVYTDTDVRYYPMGADAFSAMLADIARAKRFVFLEYFIIAEGKMWDELLARLTQKVREGVEVRVLYDAVGSIVSLPAGYFHRLEKRGIHAASFNRATPIFSSVVNRRDHRKILVIDGEIAYTGGMNISDEYVGLRIRFGEWKDNAVRLTGDAVRSMTLLFLEMWGCARGGCDEAGHYLPPQSGIHAEGYVQPYGDSPFDREPIAESIYLDLISRAERRIWFSTPYLVIDHALTTALVYAAKRGVDVRIVTPGIPDKRPVYALTRSYYGELLEGGVKIYEYTPGFVHAKCCICDDEAAMVGTVNLDYRSLVHHFENGVLFYRHAVIAEVEADILGMCERAELIERQPRERGLRRVISDILTAILRLFAPLF